MLRYCETYLNELVNTPRKGMFSNAARGLLWAFSQAYKFGSSLFHMGFDQGWRRRYFPPVPFVVSIGNIVAGGTGKTPLVIKLAKEVSQYYPVAVLSRGYRSPAENLSSPIALSQGRGPLYPSSYCGDEPYMISENVPDASVFVGKNRIKASIMAAKAGSRLLILDDGMQYRQLGRDLEIVVFNAYDPFGLGYFLPRGKLRENAMGLKRADLIVINHAYDRAQLLKAKHQISKFTDAPIVAMKPIITSIRSIGENQEHSIYDKKVGIFCGIGSPELFRLLLQTRSAHIVAEQTVADHMSLNKKTLNRFAHLTVQRGAEFLVCTEKDKVKFSENIDLPLPLLWTRIDLEIVEGKEHWEALIATVKARLDKMPALQGV